MRRSSTDGRRHAVAVLIAFALLYVAPNAQAAPTADELVTQGVELRRARRDEEALAAFEQAHRIEATAATLAQIALAEQALGRFVEAERHLRESLAASEPWIEKRRAALEQALQVIQSRLGWLEVSSNVKGVTLWLDGEPVAELPSAALRLKIGAHRVSLRAADGRVVERDVELGPGERLVLALEFPQSAPQGTRVITNPLAPPRPAPPVSDDGSVRTWAYVSAAVAGVALAEAVAASLLRLGYVDEYNSDKCAPDRSQRCAPQRKIAGTFGTIAVVGYAVAGAAGLTSVALFTEPWWNGEGDAKPRAGLRVSGSF